MDHFTNLPMDWPSHVLTPNQTPDKSPNESITTFVASDIDGYLFHDQDPTYWSEYQPQFGEASDLDEAYIINSTGSSNISPDPHIPLTNDLSHFSSDTDAGSHFTAALESCLNAAVSSEEYVELAYLLEQTRPPSNSPTTTFESYPQDHNQAAIFSTSTQPWELGSNATPSTSTMSSSTMTNDVQPFDHASDSGHNTKSNVTDRTPPALNPPNNFHCKFPDCNKEFVHLYMLRRHEKRHTKPFPCPVCERTFGAKKDLDRHLWARHEEHARRSHVPCPIRVCPEAGCGIECRGDNLKRHMESVHGRKRRPRIR